MIINFLSFASLLLCAFALSFIMLRMWRFNRICASLVACDLKLVAIRRLALSPPLLQLHNLHAAVLTGTIAALSGFSGASRFALVSFQRITPSLLPAISAGIRHK
jgi:hypothetical protein